jgi:hypothetical protein
VPETLYLPKVVYLMTTYAGQFQETLDRLRAAAGHVDAVVAVVPDPADLQCLTMEQEGELIRAVAVGDSPVPCAINHEPWADDLVRYRNAGLRAAREMKADWVLAGDPDEAFSEKLLTDLKPKIVPSLEKMGLDVAGLMCLEEFDDAEWPDKLEGLDDLAKPPSPGGRETTWHPKLFRLLPDTAYQGTAASAALAVAGLKSGNLPYHYSYTHRKTALRVWRNAAFRLYLSGGGQDAGELNAMWGALLKVCQALNIGNWPLLEKYVVTFHPNTTHRFGEPFREAQSGDNSAGVGVAAEERWPDFNPLVDWCRRALSWKATDYGLDCRRTAEWVVWHHRDLLEDRGIAEGLLTPPKRTAEDDAEDLVAQKYLEVLGRRPDAGGMEAYKRAILSGRLPREQLAAALQASPEYRQKAGGAPAAAGAPEDVRVDLPIVSVLRITDEWMTKTLMGSRTWKEKWQPPVDVGRFLERELGADFYKAFYELKAEGKLDLRTFILLVRRGLPEYADEKGAVVNQGGAAPADSRQIGNPDVRTLY